MPFVPPPTESIRLLELKITITKLLALPFSNATRSSATPISRQHERIFQAELRPSEKMQAALNDTPQGPP